MGKVFFMISSPFAANSIGLVKVFSDGSEDAAILCEDGIYWAVNEEKRKELSDNVDKVYAVGESLLARGFDLEDAEDVGIITYDDMVDLIMERYDKVIMA